MPATVAPSSTTNAPTFFSAIVLSASNTIVSGVIVQTSRPLVFNISATVFIQPLADQFVSRPAISYRETRIFARQMVLKTSCSLFLFSVKSLPSPEWFTSASAYEPAQNQLAPNLSTSRRAFLEGAALTVVALSLPVSVASDFIETKASRLTV